MRTCVPTYFNILCHTRRNFEDIVQRQFILPNVKIGQKLQVLVVMNLNTSHQRNNPMLLSKDHAAHGHIPALPNRPPKLIRFDDRVVSVDFLEIKSIQLL